MHSILQKGEIMIDLYMFDCLGLSMNNRELFWHAWYRAITKSDAYMYTLDNSRPPNIKHPYL